MLVGGFNFINASIYPLVEGWHFCLFLKNEHLLSFILRLAFCKGSNALFIMSKCSFPILVYINMSSKYVRYPKPGLLWGVSSRPKRLYMRQMKKSGPYNKPNGSLKNSNFPNTVMKALLGIDSLPNLMW